MPLRKKWGKKWIEKCHYYIFWTPCLIVTANPIMLMTEKSYHSMEEQGGGEGESLDVDKVEQVNKVTPPGFDELGILAIRW